ncbi:hypothetical protein D9611_001517 [Ephemerocybe angulata]|uniref:F-box domain-containing protein n=1 Tax=Ephemerocybe angulata TaxID=980116 RepID=A0A8H5CJT2_9AGAR|nr:hypothetical protein D9611_001517 [Tulosesus angulatus]
MDRDFYCIVSGNTQFRGNQAAILDELDEIVDEELINPGPTLGSPNGEGDERDGANDQSEKAVSAASPKPREKLFVEGLLLSEEDVEASDDLILIAAYDPSTLGAPLCQEDDEPPYVQGLTHAVTLFDVIPDPDENLGGSYLNKNTGDVYSIWWQEVAFVVTFSAYCIFKTVAPEIGPSELYRVFTHPDYEDCEPLLGIPKTIDYGPIADSFDQNVKRINVCGSPSHEIWWNNLLRSSPDWNDEETLREAWHGKGNLWVFVKPDKFPISDTVSASPLTRFSVGSRSVLHAPSSKSGFTQLPLEILFLICEPLPLKSFLAVLSLDKRLRELLLAHSDVLSYNALKKFEPWYLPALPIKTPDGNRDREELEYWEMQWEEHGKIQPHETQSNVRWLDYRIQCSQSLSMRNRKRIWRAAKTIKDFALEQGYGATTPKQDNCSYQ